MSLHELFGEVIYAYTRRQAIEDGVLVQLSGPGYEGDDWIPAMVAEAGIRIPLAMTAEVFFDCVDCHETAVAACQDIKGRLWDVLWMLRFGKDVAPDTRMFELRATVRPDSPYRRARSPKQPSRIKLKAVVGPSDDGSPCMTITWPDQD